jgi:hypothetical protein
MDGDQDNGCANQAINMNYTIGLQSTTDAPTYS